MEEADQKLSEAKEEETEEETDEEEEETDEEEEKEEEEGSGLIPLLWICYGKQTSFNLLRRFFLSFFFFWHMADIVISFATFLSCTVCSPGYLFRLSNYPRSRILRT